MPPPRKKLKRRKVKDGIRFLTFSCFRREQLLGTPRWRDNFANLIEVTRQKFQFLMIAWVIMPEHVHLLIRPPLGQDDIVKPLTWLKRESGKAAIGRWRALKAPVLHKLKTPSGRYQYWQDGGGYDRNLHSRDEIVEKANYIHNNPVTRGLVTRPCDWPWSSARWYLGIRENAPVTVDLTAWHTFPTPPQWWLDEQANA